MANGNIEVTVNLDKTCNEALFEFAQNFYEKTGQRIQHVSFDWNDCHIVGSYSHALKDVTVTSSGGGK